MYMKLPVLHEKKHPHFPRPQNLMRNYPRVSLLSLGHAKLGLRDDAALWPKHVMLGLVYLAGAGQTMRELKST